MELSFGRECSYFVHRALWFESSFDRFYVLLPAIPPAHTSPRTFCLLPGSTEDSFQSFVPARNTLAEDEVRAHVSMFEPGQNDGYYQLGLEVAVVIRQALADRHAVVHNTVVESGVESRTEEVHAVGEQQATNHGSDLLLS
jgi:hypothetical protein